ncbi:MAG TPA: hypothetical protein VFV32_05200 [Acidimicrobiales bacterium]|nr:hypothetical protein [Acidimicrobiales bacterium]
MPSAKTEITEIVTGLAITGAPDLATALEERCVANVPEDVWVRLTDLERRGQHRQEFAAAWANGRHFLAADEGLRGRPPRLVEWKGPTQAPGDEVVPADLRIDHVWLVSCKYLSKVLANAAPARLFDRGLAGGPTRTAGDWYAEVAPDAYQALYAQVRLELGTRASLPPHAADLTPSHRAELRAYLDAGWSSEAQAAYRALALAVGQASAARWKRIVGKRAEAEAVLWRLLRIGSAPYFVLGAQRDRSLRFRVMTPWDWRQAHELRRFDVWGDDAGQPQVRWQAVVKDRSTGGDRVVDGHVEVRWSHGRFGKPPEAKAYLDTPHHLVPGYVTL